MHEGVRQGCPASPLVFALYMDRLEQFLASEVVAGLGASARDSIRLAGLLIPTFLFADDIVFMSRDRAVV